MTWDTLYSNWTAAQMMARARFPHLAEDAMRFARHDINKFAEHLAATHDLTPREAREEVELWLESFGKSRQKSAA